jgi:hypothetical protein
MISTPKDELGCSNSHYGAAKALFELQRFLIVTHCHDRPDTRLHHTST